MSLTKESPFVYEFGAYRLDPSERLLLREGRTVQLAPKAFAAEEARKAGAIVSAVSATDELARQRHRARKLEEAVDKWLTDPDNPETFTLSARANEIPVIYFTSAEDGKPRREKAMLSELLTRLEAGLGVTVSYADSSRVVDARRLSVDLLRG